MSALSRQVLTIVAGVIALAVPVLALTACGESGKARAPEPPLPAAHDAPSRPTTGAPTSDAGPSPTAASDPGSCGGCQRVYGSCQRLIQCEGPHPPPNAGYAEVCTKACGDACCEGAPTPGACDNCFRAEGGCKCGHRCAREGHDVGTEICYRDVPLGAACCPR